METVRQPKGIPTGGQFAGTNHNEAEVQLSAFAPKTIEARVADRDALRERKQRLQDQIDILEDQHRAHSLKLASRMMLDKHPGATTLRIVENVDGENQFGPESLMAADGSVLANVDDDDMWTYQEAAERGPDLNELIWSVPVHGRGAQTWASGIADRKEQEGGYQVYDIDLQAALHTPIPQDETERYASSRTLSKDEQALLVKSAEAHVSSLDEQIDTAIVDHGEDRDHELWLRNERDGIEQVLKPR